MPRVRLVLLDLDNTLYDWVGFYIPSFLAMVAELSRLTRVSEETLKNSFKKVHERHRTTEYAFAIQELDVLAAETGNLSIGQVLERYGSAIEAFRRERNKTLRVYDGVRETLKQLKANRKKLVALTDATMFYAVRRLKELSLEEFFDGICAPQDHGLPPGVRPKDVRRSADPERYQSSIPTQITLEPSIRKPNPAVLLAVLHMTRAAPEETLVVGDSVSRDIRMAQECGAWDVFAKYGTDFMREYYDELLKITYWTEADVSEHELISKEKVEPTFTIDRFPDLLRVISDIERASARNWDDPEYRQRQRNKAPI